MAYHMPAYLLALTKLQMTVFYNSVSHVWLQDPYPFLEGDYDILVHEDSPSLEGALQRFKGGKKSIGEVITGEFRHQLCTCLLHVRPTAGARRLLGAWIDRLKASGTPDRNPGLAQAVWNEVLKEYSKYDVTVRVLSPLTSPLGASSLGAPLGGLLAAPLQGRARGVPSSHPRGKGQDGTSAQQLDCGPPKHAAAIPGSGPLAHW